MTQTDSDPHGNDRATSPPVPEAHDHRWAYALIAVFLAALAFGAWGAWTALSPAAGAVQAASSLESARVEELEQRVATLARSEQITRTANSDLQGTLAERDEEIAALRADVAFYERFVGATGQRRGLTVHELQLQPQAGNAWHFTATLTQNLNRGAINTGTLTVAIEGTRDGRLQRLAWTDLRQEAGAAGARYSFRYFQQVEGDIVLPAGFQPLRVSVRLAPGAGAVVEKSFVWADVAAPAPPDA